MRRLALAAALLAVVGAARADETQTVSATIPYTDTNWSLPLSLPQFNVAGGTLTSVDITLQGGIVSTIKLENLDPIVNNYSASTSYQLNLNSTTGTTLLSVVPMVPNQLGVLAKTDGTLDFAGLGGVTISNLTASATKSVTLTNATDLAAFIGAGNVSLPVIANSNATITTSANAAQLVQTQAGATATVVYHYTLPPQLGSLGDTIFFDANANGKQDDGEAGAPNLTVQLLNASGAVLKTTTTADDGTYLFTDLPAGTYRVQFSKPTGYAYTVKDAGGDDALDSDADGSGLSQLVTLGIGEDNLTVDAGLVGTLCLGDRVWKDCDGDGVQDNGEPGVPGVAVHLLDGDGNVIGNTTTDANGLYRFTNLAPVDYTVDFDAPAGYGFTKQGAGTNRATDSNADVSTGQADVTLNATDLTIDAGLIGAQKIGDTVWLDCDGDGKYEPEAGEKGIPGVHVYLYGDLNNDGWPDVYFQTKTDKDGKYIFNSLLPGNYMVALSPYDLNGLSATYDLDGTNTRNYAIGRLVAGSDRLDFDFGYRKSSTCTPKPCDWWKCNPGGWSHCSTSVGGKCHKKSIQLCWLKKSCASDCSIKLYQCLITAKLNIANGCGASDAVKDAISKCDTWLKSYPVGCKVPSNASCWTSIKSHCDALDNFNCGR